VSLRLFKILSIFSGLLISGVAFAQQRFPRPDFETEYVTPSLKTPEPRLGWLEYMDVFVLFVVLALATWFVLKKRSRKSVLYLSFFTLAYFGFYRNGCICSIGAIQNVTLALVDPTYAISLTALAFFMLPLLFALFAGRVFCGGACPLGAIQDLLIIKPIELPVGVRKALGLIPYLYLGLSILFAATKTDFIICRYDPFVGIFRMDASFNMLVLGGSFLIVGMFVGRPYCRFLCPYGVLLNWTSSVSKKHLTITPSACIDCKLCERSCPMDAINKPVADPVSKKKDINRFLIAAVVIPLWMLAGGYIVSKSHVYLSRANRTVNLAELLITHPELKTDPDHIDVQTFLASGKTMDSLVEEAAIIRNQFYHGGWALGAFFGLAFGIMFARKTIYRHRSDYEPDKGNCVSCGRCMEFCPVGKEELMTLTGLKK
jgi:NosR/NirI family transcriptional regulator, nitrous oxide reductase regulator